MSDKQYVASLSYGKDSLAMLHVITDVLHWPLDRIITADVWATDTIPADLPPMVEFKKYADEEIKKRWGIGVEHFCAMNADGTRKTFEQGFYKIRSEKSNYAGQITGWPLGFGRSWCNGELKRGALNIMRQSAKGCTEYVGIAVDEPIRIERHKGKCLMPLVDAKWAEEDCREWCEKNNLLAPNYATRHRDGCWFCINQGIGELRNLRNEYPKLYRQMLDWDCDAVNSDGICFRADGRTVHDIEKRFQWEDEGYLPTKKQFRWADIENPQTNIFQYLDDDGNVDFKKMEVEHG